MEVRLTRSFTKDYRRLPKRFQVLVDNKLLLLLENSKHPSLGIKKMAGFDYIWEARVTMGYRFTFQIEGQTYLIRRVGPHDILKNP
ncbi:MAG: hypothetical protein HYT46_02355 [Candidatus Vogelbacteria bacterium]|nr:hypothetical protein [Candidatus Vogelbacteria bacterium]